MKKFLLPTVVLMVLGGFAWRDHRQLETLRDHERTLVARLAELGLVTDSGKDDPPLTKRARPSRTDRVTAYYAEISTLPADGTGTAAFLIRLFDLSPAELKHLSEQVLSDADLPPNVRFDILVSTIQQLACEDPATALAIFTHEATRTDQWKIPAHFIDAALSRLASKDPAAALAWLEESPGDFPGLFKKSTVTALLKGTAATDPKLAFQYFDQLVAGGMATNSAAKSWEDPFESPDGPTSVIVSTARTDEQRNATLSALREKVSGLPADSRERAGLLVEIGCFGPNLVDVGYDSAQKWLDSAHLTKDEMRGLIQGLFDQIKGPDQEKWVDWMLNLDDGKNNGDFTGNLVSRWAKQNASAAEAWMTALPDGPEKVMTIATYATDIAEEKPDIALKWARTLPPGKIRQSAFEEMEDAIQGYAPEHQEVLKELGKDK